MSQYYFAESRSRIVDKIFTVNRNLSRTMASSEVAVWVSAILVWIMGIVLAWKAVPQCTLPDKGWVLFLVNHVTCLWLSVRFLAVIRGDNMLPSPKLMGPVLTMIVRTRLSSLGTLIPHHADCLWPDVLCGCRPSC